MCGRKLLRACDFWVRSNKEQPWQWGFPGSFRQAGGCQPPKGETLGAFTPFFPIQTRLGCCSSGLLLSWGCWFSGPHRDGVREKAPGQVKAPGTSLFLLKFGLCPWINWDCCQPLISRVLQSLTCHFCWCCHWCCRGTYFHEVALAVLKVLTPLCWRNCITVSLLFSSGTWKTCLGWIGSCYYEHNSATVRIAEPEDKWSLNLPYRQIIVWIQLWYSIYGREKFPYFIFLIN